MSENALAFGCKCCLYRWDEPQQLPMEMGAFAKKVRKTRCPKCDAPSLDLAILFGTEAIKNWPSRDNQQTGSDR